ncbi:MAG: hypothetical protein DRJ38_04155 [Thermoprotei archaeon]|nr:MAG: hypothetical protein DRJ38_04155 [Thermoprotei archaeon]
MVEEDKARYEVYWTKTAVKDLRREMVKRIIDMVEEASLEPLRYFKKLKGLPLCSLRWQLQSFSFYRSRQAYYSSLGDRA